MSGRRVTVIVDTDLDVKLRVQQAVRIREEARKPEGIAVSYSRVCNEILRKGFTK